MNKKFVEFVYKTRGIYMFIALAVSMVLKLYFGGATPLSFFVGGIILALSVQQFRMWSASFLLGKQAVIRPQADFLCTSGPYAFVRNPLYLGNFLIGIAVCIAINEWYAYLLFAASYAFVYSIVIPYEENFLQEKFGTEYSKYKANVGSLIPSLKSFKGGAKVIPDFKAGILGEIHVPFILALLFVITHILFVR